MYLTSQGRPTDIGLQLGKAAVLITEVFTFIAVPLSSLSSLSFFSTFSIAFLWETTQILMHLRM